MKNKYVLIDLRNMDYFKDLDGNLKVFDTEDDAHLHCGMYECENVWICKLMYNYIDEE